MILTEEKAGLRSISNFVKKTSLRGEISAALSSSLPTPASGLLATTVAASWIRKLFSCPSLHRLAHARSLQACGAHRYDVMQYIVFPATKEKQCSYVELVAPEGTTAQTPTWFVSHWYGRRVLSDMESGISMSSCELETCFLF